VHHIQPLGQGGNRYDPANMLSLCAYHHGLRHNARPRGCAADGTPTDPGHPWRQE
jgi:hypothetical protein